jgi:hypothetical protein
MSTTPRSSLAVGEKLADGGQGKVFALSNDPEHVFKEYHNPDDPLFRPDMLQHLVDDRAQLVYAGAKVDDWAAWPVSVVTDGPKTVGFLMRRVPAEFALRVRGKDKLAELGYLGSAPKPLWGPIQLPTPQERIEIAQDLAGAMDALHQRKIVIGDLSFANVLWTGSPRPRIMFLDCDGMRPEGRDPVLPQAETLDWGDPLADPNARTGPTIDRDCYKLALAVLRILTRSLNARPDPTTTLDRALFEHAEAAERVETLLRAAAGPVGSRPTAKQWTAALSGRAFVSVTKPPRARTIEAPQPQPDMFDRGQPRKYQRVVPPKG